MQKSHACALRGPTGGVQLRESPLRKPDRRVWTASQLARARIGSRRRWKSCCGMQRTPPLRDPRRPLCQGGARSAWRRRRRPKLSLDLPLSFSWEKSLFLFFKGVGKVTWVERGGTRPSRAGARRGYVAGLTGGYEKQITPVRKNSLSLFLSLSRGGVTCVV